MNQFCLGITIILVGCKNELRDDPYTISHLKYYDGWHPVTYDEVGAQNIQEEILINCIVMSGNEGF